MSRFVDLSHTPETGMPGFSMTGPDGRGFQATAETATMLDHQDSAPLYDGKVAFAFTRANFHTSIGTRPVRLCAVPVRARGAASMPMRAFAELLDGEDAV